MNDEKRSTTAIPMKKRATVHAVIAFDIEGDSDEQIAERFVDAIEAAHDNVDGIRDITVQSSETIGRPFVVPPGAERWSPLAGIRFGEDLPRAAMWDGSWWWTDGHAAYRCDGDPPEGFKRIEDAFKSEAYATPERATEWGGERREGSLVKRIASVDDSIALQSKYVAPVELAHPDATWTCGPDINGPTRAYVGKQVVAVVMPCRRGA